MAFSDITNFIAMAATVVAAGYSILTYHRPKATPMKKDDESKVSRIAPLAAVGRQWPWRLIPIVAVLVAWGAVLFGYFAPPRSSGDRAGYPISVLFALESTSLSLPTRVGGMAFFSENITDDQIKMDASYIVSGMTGERLDLLTDADLQHYPISEINPVPAGTLFWLTANPSKSSLGMTVDDFKKDWAKFELFIEYEGQTERIKYDEQRVEKSLSLQTPEIPRITAKNPKP